ncbi:MAG: ThuA domain-containing protein [Sedimentisphaerales bacterium]|nr:ThuA domain-containing protein [Sedimentisphaerales bacterium]
MENVQAEVKPAELEMIKKAAPDKAPAVPQKARKLLVFSRCEGYVHSSIPYVAAAIEILGQKTGAYEVVHSVDMSAFQADNLKQFDGICLNNNTHLKFAPELRESIMAFIKDGKGIIGIHAASDGFYDWPEAATMIGGQFCGHPWTWDGTWRVKIDEPDHPLMASFKEISFDLNEEIYRTRLPYYSRTHQRVLMSLDMTDPRNLGANGVEPGDKDVGLSWVKQVGKGRLFYCALGHNHHITWNPAVLGHYLAGIQYALGDLQIDDSIVKYDPGKLEKLLVQAVQYQEGQDDTALMQVSTQVALTFDTPGDMKKAEKLLLEVLSSDMSPAAANFLCKQLGFIATGDSVDVLDKLISDKKTSESALFALERVEGESAGKVLRKELMNTKGQERIKIIHALGRRRDRKSVPLLNGLIHKSDTPTTTAAIEALGQIGDHQAARVLSEARDHVSVTLQPVLLQAYIQCAGRILDMEDAETARDIYMELYSPDNPEQIRVIAFKGLIKADPQNAVQHIVDALKTDNQPLQEAAVAMVKEIEDDEIVEAFSNGLPTLPDALNKQLKSILAEKKKE